VSHNLCNNTMMYVGKEPWHGLGVKLNDPVTSEEAIKFAGLDYEVALHPIMTDFRVIDGMMATARADNNEVFGVVSNRYKIIQNRDAFSFFDNVVGEKRAIYHTAGALGKGERIWMLAKLPNDLFVTKEDRVEKYLCLTNTHDGKSSLKMYFTPVRVVCQNTLTLSLTDSMDGISIRHSGDIKSKVEEAQRVLGIAVEFYKEFGEKAERFRRYNMNLDDAETFFKFMVFGSKDEDVEDTQKMDKKLQLLNLFENGQGNKLEGVRHTAWAGYNAVTEFVDHHSTIRGVKNDPTNRLKNIWFGTGAKFKRLAFDTLSEMVGVI